MRYSLLTFGLVLAIPVAVHAQSVELPTPPAYLDGPTNHAVLLPPIPDVPVKGPNNNRERYGEFSISGGIMLLQPTFTTNPAFSITGPGNTNVRHIEFGQRLEAAPDFWLAYQSERGWGVRGRWFQFDHDANASYAVMPGETIRGVTSFPIGQTPVAGTAFADSNLRVSVFDAQFTRSFGNDRWTHLFGVGLRYSHMSQDYRTTLASPATQINLVSGHNFNGWGPSLSWETKRRFGDSGFAIYAQTHFSATFGRGHDSALAVNGALRSETDRAYTDVLPVGELETGIEYVRDLRKTRLVVQTGFVGQAWWGGGNASNFDAPATTASGDSNFGLLGFVVRAGVRY